MTLPITTIIVSFNSAEVLASCIESVRTLLMPEQLVVVDNASLDTSVEIARENGAEVVVNSVNRGFGAACNRGARSARSDLLMFVNPDVCVTSVDTVALRELATRDPLGLVGPRTLGGATGDRAQSTLRRVLPWPCLVAREALGPILPHAIARLLSASLDSPGPRSWLSGALLVCRRAEFLRLGGFDERFFLYYEDQELCRRYETSGLPLSITDAIAGRHIGGGSSGDRGMPRPIPRAASAISSIEMVGVTRGVRHAQRAWVLYRTLQRFTALVIWLAGRSPLAARSADKCEELNSTQSALETLLAGPAPPYPIAKALTRTASQRASDRALVTEAGRD